MPPQAAKALAEIKATISVTRARWRSCSPNAATGIPGCLARLAHPVALTAGKLGELARLAGDLAISQPLRQLWRETCRVTVSSGTRVPIGTGKWFHCGQDRVRVFA
jgi:hypothetical protein